MARRRAASLSALGASALVVSAIAIGACSRADQTTFTTTGVGGSSSASSTGNFGGFNAGTDGGPPPLDAGGLCGNQQHEIVSDSPNIYFVLDTSGSMASVVTGTKHSRYDLLRDAAINVVRSLGALINVGAALFPQGASAKDSCAEGKEVMPVQPGTSAPDDPNAGDSATTLKFEKATNVDPKGGTPVSATLNALLPNLKKLPGRTIVVLATDGGPNCNASAVCDKDQCMANIEGMCVPAVNCCAPGGPAGPEMCIDRPATVSAISAFASAGIQVYVVGIPGSETYSDVLGAMALAGGAPGFAPPYYFKVDDAATLSATLGSIASLVVSCDFDVKDPPKTPDMTNVYLDNTVLPADPVNGWAWKTPTVVELRGDACQRLKSGKVRRVQIVSGCPTEMPK
jgi:hypothetical protein